MHRYFINPLLPQLLPNRFIIYIYLNISKISQIPLLDQLTKWNRIKIDIYLVFLCKLDIFRPHFVYLIKYYFILLNY